MVIRLRSVVVASFVATLAAGLSATAVAQSDDRFICQTIDESIAAVAAVCDESGENCVCPTGSAWSRASRASLIAMAPS